MGSRRSLSGCSVLWRATYSTAFTIRSLLMRLSRALTPRLASAKSTASASAPMMSSNSAQNLSLRRWSFLRMNNWSITRMAHSWSALMLRDCSIKAIRPVSLSSKTVSQSIVPPGVRGQLRSLVSATFTSVATQASKSKGVNLAFRTRLINRRACPID